MLFTNIGDCHLDLTIDGINMNPEIRNVMLYSVNWAIKRKSKYFVFNGDIFDNNTPSDEAIGIFLECLSLLNEAGIKTFVVDGNHEKKHRGEPSCLHFITKIKAFKNIRVIHDITGIKVSKKVYVIFFPHVNKPNIPKEFKTPQDYVEHRANRFLKQLDLFKTVLVFSHLNVKGVIPGTEEHMLKKSEVYLPDAFHTSNLILGPDPITINGHIHCFDQQTEVLTLKGWKKYSDVLNSDVLPSLNTDTYEIENSKIVDRIERDYSGEMIRVKHTGVDLLVTPNHRLLGKKIYHDRSLGEYEYFLAGDFPTGEWSIPKAGHRNNQSLDMSDLHIQLIVQVVTDGSYDGPYVRFHFKKKRKIDRLIQLLTQASIPYTHTIQKNGNSKILFKRSDAIFLPEIKQLPSYFIELNYRQCNLLLNEYAITDGYNPKGDSEIIQICTAKKEEADLLQHICTVNGVCCNITVKKSKYYILSINRKKCSITLHKSRSITTEQYVGKVWCFTTSTGTLVVRRNGKVCITGNSAQKDGHVHIIGSPVFCSFGEKEDKKYFAAIKIYPKGDKVNRVKLIESPCPKFHEINLEIKKPKDFSVDGDIISCLQHTNSKRDYVKISVTGPEGVLDIDWESIRQHLIKHHCKYVKPIKPVVTRKRAKRNPRQNINLKPHDAVAEFLKSNKPKNRKRVLRLANKYLNEVL